VEGEGVSICYRATINVGLLLSLSVVKFTAIFTSLLKIFSIANFVRAMHMRMNSVNARILYGIAPRQIPIYKLLGFTVSLNIEKREIAGIIDVYTDLIVTELALLVPKEDSLRN